MSWWRYEWAAIAWGRSFGLAKPNHALRGPNYPPTTITRALELSNSRPTRLANAAAERLAQRIATPDDSGSSVTALSHSHSSPESSSVAASKPSLSADDELWVTALMDPPRRAFEQWSWPEKLARAVAGRIACMSQSHDRVKAENSSAGTSNGNARDSSNANNLTSSPRSKRLDVGVLPSWALTWPGGQLACVGRSGDFASNIARVEAAFAASTPSYDPPRLHRHRDHKHGRNSDDGAEELEPFVTVVDLSELANSEQLSALLRKVASSIRARRRMIDGVQPKPKRHGSSNQEAVGEDDDSSDDVDAPSASFLSRVEVETYLQTHVANDHGNSTSSSGDHISASSSQPLKRNAGPTTLRGLGAGPNGATASGMGEEPTPSERSLLVRRFEGQGGTLGRLRGQPVIWK